MTASPANASASPCFVHETGMRSVLPNGESGIHCAAAEVCPVEGSPEARRQLRSLSGVSGRPGGQ